MQAFVEKDCQYVYHAAQMGPLVFSQLPLPGIKKMVDEMFDPISLIGPDSCRGSHHLRETKIAGQSGDFLNCVLFSRCPQRGSNSCFGLERAASWAAR